jgi:hypothetical protein
MVRNKFWDVLFEWGCTHHRHKKSGIAAMKKVWQQIHFLRKRIRREELSNIEERRRRYKK